MSGWLFLSLALHPGADPKPDLAHRALDPEAVAHWELAQQHESKRSKLWSPGPAFVNYAKAIEIEPRYAAPYLDRGRLYFEGGKLDEALADYDAAVRLLPQFAGGFIRRGDLHLSRGGDRKALADFEEAIRLLTASDKPVVVGNHRYQTPAWKGLDYAYSRRCLARLMLKDRNAARSDLEAAVLHVQKTYVPLPDEDLNKARRAHAERYQLSAAWVLATHPDDAVRDGRLAQQLVAKAEALNPGTDASEAYPVRAAVSAELGMFAKAVEWEKKYHDRVSGMAWGEPSSRSDLRLAEYERRRPLRARSTWFLPEKP